MADQVWSPETYEESARFVSDHGAGVVDWLAPKPGERILDLGCGDGALTLDLLARGAEVIGVDSSPEMIAGACSRGIDARVMSGESLTFDQEFDAVFSNAALHWMRQPDAVIAGVRKSLRRGGRFVGEFGGFGNVAAIRVAIRAVGRAHGIDPALTEPWFFPDEETYTSHLVAGGFAVDRMVLFPRPTPLPETGIKGWLKVFCGPFFAAFEDGPKREAALDEVIELLAPLRRPNGRWVADYVRLRFAARSI